MDEPLLPQQPTSANVEVLSVEWLFEPFWPGERLMVHIDEQATHVTDASGEPARDDLSEVAGLLRIAVTANQVIVDGVWTAQPFLSGVTSEFSDLAGSERHAFVAVDLVELDGDSLVDVPFQERRRMLESVIREGVQVRVSRAVKQPIRGWLIGWRANGFSHYVAKHMNSRYEPGASSDEWLKISTREQPQRGVLGHLLGSRERPRRIRD